MTGEDKLSHLEVRCCGEIVRMSVFASSHFLLQVVFERSEHANDDVADLV